jgi:hypothetical protein
MARIKFCPKCDADLAESYEPPSKGGNDFGSWYCEDCDLIIENEDDEYADETQADSASDAATEGKQG